MRKTITAAALALAVALGGCASTNTNKDRDDIPTEAKENFIDTCAETARKTRPGNDQEIRKNCQCVVDKLDERIPYQRGGGNNDFKDADSAVRDGRALTGGLRDDFDQATADCVQDR